MDYWFNLIYEDRVINLKYVREFSVVGKELVITYKDGGNRSHKFENEADAKHWCTITYDRLTKLNNGGNL